MYLCPSMRRKKGWVCPLPWGEGGRRPAFSPAGAGRVRGKKCAPEKLFGALRQDRPRACYRESWLSTSSLLFRLSGPLNRGKYAAEFSLRSAAFCYGRGYEARNSDGLHAFVAGGLECMSFWGDNRWQRQGGRQTSHSIAWCTWTRFRRCSGAELFTRQTRHRTTASHTAQSTTKACRRAATPDRLAVALVALATTTCLFTLGPCLSCS